MTKQVFSHFKLQGEWAELLFMARVAERGLTILRPWGDSSPYELNRWSAMRWIFWSRAQSLKLRKYNGNPIGLDLPVFVELKSVMDEDQSESGARIKTEAPKFSTSPLRSARLSDIKDKPSRACVASRTI